MKTTLLPTTMVGSYPRPAWFRDQLDGRDVLEAWKVIHRKEAFEDAVRTVLADQANAGLDILTDGQMWFDDYGMGIGSFHSSKSRVRPSFTNTGTNGPTPVGDQGTSSNSASSFAAARLSRAGTIR